MRWLEYVLAIGGIWTVLALVVGVMLGRYFERHPDR
jgi:uncharacterized protein YneF (UPF0154 family)